MQMAGQRCQDQFSGEAGTDADTPGSIPVLSCQNNERSKELVYIYIIYIYFLLDCLPSWPAEWFEHVKVLKLASLAELAMCRTTKKYSMCLQSPMSLGQVPESLHFFLRLQIITYTWHRFLVYVHIITYHGFEYVVWRPKQATQG